MVTLDVVAALDAFAASAEERGDEALAHVSDLMACDRETWARRSGIPMVAFDAATRRKFALGNAVEDYVLEALVQAGTPIRRNVRVALYTDNDELRGRELTEDEEPKGFEVVGHVDGVTDDFVIEVKSTTFRLDRKTWKRMIPTREGVQEHYKVQGASYAIALGKRLVIAIVCRESGEAIAYEYDPEEWREHIAERIDDVRLFTAPSQPMPPADPPEAWRCKYCRYQACEKWARR